MISKRITREAAEEYRSKRKEEKKIHKRKKETGNEETYKNWKILETRVQLERKF